jgi:hypothetical protein
MRKLKFSIKRLREIGWSLWNPICLSQCPFDWCGEPYEDEYDTYLSRAAAMIHNGADDSKIVAYLYCIEAEYMGLTEEPISDEYRQKLAAVAFEIRKEVFPTLH